MISRSFSRVSEAGSVIVRCAPPPPPPPPPAAPDELPPPPPAVRRRRLRGAEHAHRVDRRLDVGVALVELERRVHRLLRHAELRADLGDHAVEVHLEVLVEDHRRLLVAQPALRLHLADLDAQLRDDHLRRLRRAAQDLQQRVLRDRLVRARALHLLRLAPVLVHDHVDGDGSGDAGGDQERVAGGRHRCADRGSCAERKESAAELPRRQRGDAERRRGHNDGGHNARRGSPAATTSAPPDRRPPRRPPPRPQPSPPPSPRPTPPCRAFGCGRRCARRNYAALSERFLRS